MQHRRLWTDSGAKGGEMIQFGTGARAKAQIIHGLPALSHVEVTPLTVQRVIWIHTQQVEPNDHWRADLLVPR